MCVYIYMQCIYVCLYIWIFMYVYMYIYIYEYICIIRLIKNMWRQEILKSFFNKFGLHKIILRCNLNPQIPKIMILIIIFYVYLQLCSCNSNVDLDFKCLFISCFFAIKWLKNKRWHNVADLSARRSSRPIRTPADATRWLFIEVHFIFCMRQQQQINMHVSLPLHHVIQIMIL